MLKENNVRLIGVGLEAIGVKEFIDAKYLEGGRVLQIFYLMVRISHFRFCEYLYLQVYALSFYI